MIIRHSTTPESFFPLAVSQMSWFAGLEANQIAMAMGRNWTNCLLYTNLFDAANALIKIGSQYMVDSFLPLGLHSEDVKPFDFVIVHPEIFQEPELAIKQLEAIIKTSDQAGQLCDLFISSENITQVSIILANLGMQAEFIEIQMEN
jgi:hypothetical protein